MLKESEPMQYLSFVRVSGRQDLPNHFDQFTETAFSMRWYDALPLDLADNWQRRKVIC
jgi:hypothetical protein